MDQGADFIFQVLKAKSEYFSKHFSLSLFFFLDGSLFSLILWIQTPHPTPYHIHLSFLMNSEYYKPTLLMAVWVLVGWNLITCLQRHKVLIINILDLKFSWFFLNSPSEKGNAPIMQVIDEDKYKCITLSNLEVAGRKAEENLLRGMA